MSNFINPSVLAAEALDQLDYELVAGNMVYRDRTADFAAVRGLKVGDTVTIRTVTDFQTNEFTAGGSITTQEIQQSSTQLVIEKHFDVSVTVGAKERALNLDGIRKEIINPAMTSMAQKVDSYLLEKVVQSQGLFASATLLETASDIADARAQANLQQIAKTGRLGLVSNDLEATLLGSPAFSSFDTRGQSFEGSALQEAVLGRLMGIDWFSSVNFPDNTLYTPGDGATTLDNTVATDNLQGSTTLVVDSTSGTFEIGDKIQIAGAKRAYTIAAQAVATSTSLTLVEQISENLGDLDGNAITVISDSVPVEYQGLILNEGAFGFAAPPLDTAAGDLSGVASANGMSVRMTEAYDINAKETVWSFDMLIGAKAIDPRLALLLGAQ